MRVYYDVKAFLYDIYCKRYVIYELAKRDFQAKNQGSYLGPAWMFLQPLAFIGVLWFVFGIGLRAGQGGDVPFLVYLVWGMIAWLFFANNVAALTGVVQQHNFLVKKGDFSLGILPIMKLLSALIPHLALMGMAVLISLANGIYPGLYTLQLIYYLAAMLLFMLGLGWILSSTSLFVPDVADVIAIAVRFGFFLTPIFWEIDRIPESYRWILQLNPMYYIVNGYRDSIIYNVPFWSKPYETLLFWSITLCLVFLGSIVFRKLKPHFAEVV